ncbi:MAG: ArnT family glycosyltransferase [Planctomycetota bacterium]
MPALPVGRRYGSAVWWATTVLLGGIFILSAIAAGVMYRWVAIWGFVVGSAVLLATRLGRGAWVVNPRPWQWLVGVLALAAAARLAAVLLIPYRPAADFLVYHTAGVRMAERWKLAIGNYRCFFPPGQIFSLGVIYALFDNSVKAAQILNVIWATLTVAGVWYVGRTIAGPRVGRTASLIAALLPSTIFACMVLGAEVPQTFWFVLAMCFFVGPLERQGKLWAALACGLSLGIASLIRPTFVLVCFVLGLHMLLSRQNRRRAIFAALLIIAGTAAVVAPWTYRNHRATGGFVLISSNGGGNLYSANNDDAKGDYTDSAWRYVFENSNGDDLKLQRIGRDMALDWIARNPHRFAYLALIKAGRFWYTDVDLTWWALQNTYQCHPDLGTSSELRYWALLITSGFYVALVLACFIAAVRFRSYLWANRGWMVIPVVAAYFMALHMIFESQCKYHYMLPPLLCVLAALAVRPRGATAGPAGPAATTEKPPGETEHD